MSTRCQIRIVKNGYPLNIYHHCDGYFSGVGAELQDILKENSERLSANWLVAHLLNQCDGYEVTFGIHADIEYFYLIDLDKKEFKACRLKIEVWAKAGSDEYDQYQPWYNQFPLCEKVLNLMEDEMVD